MSEKPSEVEPIEILADSFLDRHRRGEGPDPEDYVALHPELAGQIRDLFPALLALEAGAAALAETGDAGPAAAGPPRRLGDFRIVREVGRGGMGIVYEAVQESLGRHAALKVLPSQGPAAKVGRERFRREALAAARLHHTNIVPVFGIGECDGIEYYAMQFIRGRGLDEVLAELRRIRAGGPALAADDEPAGEVAETVARPLIDGEFASSPEDAARTEDATGEDVAGPRPGPGGGDASPVASANGIGASQWSGGSGAPFYRSVAAVGLQVARALEHAHSHGILHRDVKPANLLLDTTGTVWVADFGLAKSEGSDDLTGPGDVVGTLRYMAPERFRGRSLASSDVYSLGLTLYELLTTRPAFEEADRARLIDRIANAEPTPARRLDPRIPGDLETIVAKAIAKDPTSRYATAGALAEDLERFLEDRPIRARRIGGAERAWRWCRRNPTPAAAIAAAAASLVAAAVVAVLYADRERRIAVEQTRAAGEIGRLASDLDAERSRLASSFKESSRRLAVQQFQRAQAAFEAGEVGVGLLWAAECWGSAVEAEDPAWAHAARGEIAAWSPAQPRLRAVLSDDRPISKLAVSPDGKRAATRGEGGGVRLWDLGRSEPVGPALGDSPAGDVLAFSPDGERLATSTPRGRIDLWDPETGRTLGSMPNPLPSREGISHIAFRPGGRQAFVSSWSGNLMLDLDAGRTLGPLAEPTGPIFCVAVSPDGERILTGNNLGQVRLWDATTRKPMGPPLAHAGRVWAVAFSPDGESFATGCVDGRARLWETSSGKALDPPLVHQAEVRGVAFSPDGRYVLTGSVDKTARLWRAADHVPIGPAYRHEGPIEAIAVTPDGRSVLTAGGDSTARLWDLDVGRRDRLVFGVEHGGLIAAVAFAPDGKTFLTAGADRAARAWDAATGLPARPPISLPERVSCLAVSPDGKTLAAGCRDRRVCVGELATGRILGEPLWIGSEVSAVSFSPDGRTFLTGTQDGALQLWEAGTRTPVGEPFRQDGSVEAAAFSPDGSTILTGDALGGVHLWDAAARRPLGPIVAHPGCVSAVAFSPDGRSFAMGGEDGTCRIRDLATRRPIGPRLVHKSWIFGVAFSPDGKFLATASRDGTARLWDVATGMAIGPPFEHPDRAGVARVAFSPDGRSLLISGENSRTACLFRTAPPQPDDLGRYRAWVGVATGLRLDASGSVEVLDNAGWLAARRRLDDLGGAFVEEPPPRPGPN